MNKAKIKILHVTVVLFLLLYAFTVLAWGVESLLAPVVTPVQVKKSSVIVQRNFDAVISQEEQSVVVHWRMSEGELEMLEGSNSQCYYYTYTSQGLQFAQAKCVDVISEETPDENGKYIVNATLETQVSPAEDYPVYVVVKQLNAGLQTVPVSAISYVDGVSCLMQLVHTADGWRVQAQEVSISVSNGSVASVASSSDFSPKTLYASGAYRDLLDGEKVRVIDDVE